MQHNWISAAIIIFALLVMFVALVRFCYDEFKAMKATRRSAQKKAIPPVPRKQHNVKQFEVSEGLLKHMVAPIARAKGMQNDTWFATRRAAEVAGMWN